MTPEPVVDVRGLRMEYSGRTVLDNIDLRIDRGEVVALLGPNGAGKTTTIEILEGFRQRVGGEVSVLGGIPSVRATRGGRRSASSFSRGATIGRWRVGQLLQQFGAMYEPYATSDRPGPYPAAELLELVGLAAHRDAQVRSLSGGQRRRLDVAIGIVGRPELLFLDEPTTGFDPVARHEFHELIHRLSDFDETTVLLTTHDLAEAEKIAGRILILDGGRIVADGSAAALAGEVAGASEITWREDGMRHVHSAADPVPFVRELLNRPGTDITELQVRAQTLEETYLAMVARREAVPVGGEVEEVERA